MIDRVYMDNKLSEEANQSHKENTRQDRGYWWLNANPKIWSWTSLSIGDVEYYTLYSEKGYKRRYFKNFIDAKKGDLVIGYESTPVKQVVALAEVAAEADDEEITFMKTEDLPKPVDYQTLKACPKLKGMQFFKNPTGSFFKLTKDEYYTILKLAKGENIQPDPQSLKSYTKNDFLSEVYLSETDYDRLNAVLLNKQNIILQGAPGVGKTFCARRLAYSLMGEKDDDRIELVQFHQNYSYEDFVMGYRPTENGFKLKKGIFLQFCQKAANFPDKKFFFIIDEINRGNLSKIFGELLMLIEKDYRGTSLTLAYDGEKFSVPNNLYIIGMMNTADRSLAMIDYAMRRRFAFFEISPAFDSKGFTRYQKSLENDTFNVLISTVSHLNQEIRQDPSLGKGFCIGHSYFCGRTKDDCTDEWMKSVVDFDILPMLSEYWFDDDSKYQKWENILHGVFQ